MPSDDRAPPELRAPKQNPYLGSAARGMANVEDFLDRYFELPLDVLLPVSSEFLEKASYGDPFFRMAPSSTGSRIPMTTDKDYLMEALFAAAAASPVVRSLRRAGGKGSKKGAEPGFAEELSMYLNGLEAQRYAKGGRVRDFLAEVLSGGGTDPGRRAALGLPRDLTPKPGEVVVKEEIKTAPKKGETSVSMTEAMNIPMSRRDVLRAGAGQAMSAMAPRGALGALARTTGSPMSLAREVTKPAGVSTLQGLIAQALARGLPESEMVRKGMALRPDMNEFEIQYLSDLMRSPDDFTHEFGPDRGPLGNIRQMLDVPEGSSIKSALREIRDADPEMYAELKRAARDITDLSLED